MEVGICLDTVDENHPLLGNIDELLDYINVLSDSDAESVDKTKVQRKISVNDNVIVLRSDLLQKDTQIIVMKM